MCVASEIFFDYRLLSPLFAPYLSLNQYIMSTKLYLRKNSGNVKISLRYRPNRQTNIVVATPFSIAAEKWDSQKEIYSESFKKKKPTNEVDKKQNIFIDGFNIKLNEFKTSIDSFIMSNNFNVGSTQLKNFINQNFGGKDKIKLVKKSVSFNSMSQFIEEYITEKSVHSLGKHKPLTLASIKKFRVIKNKLEKINSKLTIQNIDDNFRDTFTQWCITNRYSETTIVKELKIIKTFIKFAKSKKYKVNDDVFNWSFYINPKEYKHPTLSFSELQKIESIDLDSDYLDNARDWLLIGCYTGQRVSDLLNFNHKDIFEEDFLSFTQKKTKENITIFLPPKVKSILQKRNGQFPRKISDQRFNDYIKTVCKSAEIIELMIGGKLVNKRKVIDEYSKWELVTSHICRRSFVTNFRHILGDEGVMINTGHKSQSMVDLYDQNTSLDKVKKIKDILIKKMELSEEMEK